jgi:AmmeMemoRadiSam system protein B
MATMREPAVAGRFYPGDAGECERTADELLNGAEVRSGSGAIVPHAGWVYSGSTAALGIAGVAGSSPETVVLFGAAHVRGRNEASLYAAGTWRTPVGTMHVDEEFAGLVARCRHVAIDYDTHENEHSIEVQLPLVQRVLPMVKILPIVVRPGPWAEEVGRCCARVAKELGRRVVFIGSTDLTHYGPAYGFEPYGRGEDGIRWAKEVNDRRLIRLVEKLDAAAVVPEAMTNRNACGAGAVAATVAAMLESGPVRYQELRHTTSAEVELERGVRAVNSVGYEAGIFVGT